MARYIDADRFIERLNASPAFPNMGTDGYFLLGVVENLLKSFPTADVVPKSKVAVLSFQDAALRDSFGILHKALDEAESRVASEIFDVVDELIDRICAMTGVNIILFGKYMELKKKYGGGAGRGKITDVSDFEKRKEEGK